MHEQCVYLSRAADRSPTLYRRDGGRFSQAVVREPGFNSHPSHPPERAPQVRHGKARGISARVGSEGAYAPPTGADPLRQGSGEAPQEEPVAEARMRIRRWGSLRGPFQSDEETDRGRGLPHHRGLAPQGGPQA